MGVGPEARHAKSDLRGGLNVASPEFHRLVMTLKRGMKERGFNPPYWQAKKYVLELEGDDKPTSTTIGVIIDEVNDGMRQQYADDLRRIDEIIRQNPTTFTPQEKERLIAGRTRIGPNQR